jgi:hypothetical protein
VCSIADVQNGYWNVDVDEKEGNPDVWSTSLKVLLEVCTIEIKVAPERKPNYTVVDLPEVLTIYGIVLWQMIF